MVDFDLCSANYLITSGKLLLLKGSVMGGQVGWWAGLSDDDDDPYGRIINIFPVDGRFMAKGYSARFVHQLLTSLRPFYSGTGLSFRFVPLQS